MRVLLPSCFAALALSACAMPQPSLDAQSTQVPVFFTAWSADLDPAAHDAVNHAAAMAATRPAAVVRVVGFADSVGSSQANVDLSRLRAQRVADELVAAGLPATRISRDARGATPAPDLSSQASRRVDVVIGG